MNSGASVCFSVQSKGFRDVDHKLMSDKAAISDLLVRPSGGSKKPNFVILRLGLEDKRQTD